MKKLSVKLLVLFIVLAGNLVAQDSVLLKALKNLPGIEVVGPTRHGQQYSEAYEIKFIQPVDHNNPDGPKFTQRMFIGHAGFDKPMVLSTSGYDARGLGGAEPAQLLKANLIHVEHRYFGQSAPDPIDWKCLTAWQSASDHHAIVQLFKKLYPGKWVSTGVSKDGQTAMMFKAFYPDDIDVAIPYVAPLNTAKVDPRIFDFLANVGTAEERQKVYDFQIALFEKKKEIMPMVEEYCTRKNWTFPMGIDRAYDLNVLEFPFALWQYGAKKPMDLPGKEGTAKQLFDMLMPVTDLMWFSDTGLKQFLPHYYQAMTEMGYYGYDVKPFKKYMKDNTYITYDFTLTPCGLDTTFNPKTLPFLHDFVQNRGDHILYIYGELDTWTATGVTKITGPADALVMILKGSHHGSSIRAFSAEEKQKIYDTLSRWLGFAVPVE
ncbi:MAG: S28 family serine protease [Bacteroidales bacterium]